MIDSIVIAVLTLTTIGGIIGIWRFRQRQHQLQHELTHQFALLEKQKHVLAVTRDALHSILTDIPDDLDALAAFADAVVRLHASEARFRALFDYAPIGILQANITGELVYINPTLEKILGYSHCELVGKNYYELLHPEEQIETSSNRLFEQLLKYSRNHYQTIERYQHRLGREIWASLSIAGVRDVDGGVLFVVGMVTDITEKRAAEARLAHNEMRIAEAQQLAQLGYWEWHPQNDDMFWSEEFSMQLGYPCKPIQTHLDEFYQAIIADDQQYVKYHLLALLDTSNQEKIPHFENLEFRVKIKDGKVKTLQSSGKLLRTYDDKPYCVIGTALDISERKQTELLLRKLSTAVEQSSNSILITDRKGIIQYVNPAFTKISGYLPEEVLNRTPRLLKSGLMGIDFYRDLWSTILRGDVWQGEFTNRHKSGELYYEYTTISPIRDENQEISHFLAVREDLTAYRQAVEALRNSEARYRSVIASMSEGVVLQNRTGEILTCNQAAESILGLTEAQMAGRSSLDPAWQSVRENGMSFPGYEHPAMVTLQTGLPFKNVIMGVYKTPQQDVTWIAINSQPIFTDDPSHLPTAVVTTFTDITPYKSAQKIFRETKTITRFITPWFNHFMSKNDLLSTYHLLLTELLKLTDSQLGFISDIEEDQIHTRLLLTHSLRDQQFITLFDREKTGLFATLNQLLQPILQNGSVIIQDQASAAWAQLIYQFFQSRII
ncbi:PAS domain S-box protein, partial [Thioflexithrix psekupsensis]